MIHLDSDLANTSYGYTWESLQIVSGTATKKVSFDFFMVFFVCKEKFTMCLAESHTTVAGDEKIVQY